MMNQSHSFQSEGIFLAQSVKEIVGGDGWIFHLL